MDDLDDLAARFEEHRDHLRSVARRMLGSAGEAEDAVQEAWFRLHRSDSSGVDKLAGWLTTVVSRVCLDMLRSRASRREDLGGIDTVNDRALSEQRRVVDAFLSAARHGDLEGLIAVLAPDVVFSADETAAAMGDGPARVDGAPSVAAAFSGRAQAARCAMVDGEVAVVVDPGGRLIVILDVVIIDDQIVAIDAIADPTRLARVDVAAFDD